MQSGKPRLASEGGRVTWSVKQGQGMAFKWVEEVPRLGSSNSFLSEWLIGNRVSNLQLGFVVGTSSTGTSP